MIYRRIFIVHHVILAISIICALLTSHVTASAQQLPPRPLSIVVDPAQPLSFGTFYQGSTGGSVIIDPNGSRSVTGDVVQVGSSFSPALFEVEALPGTLVSILNGPDVTLSGSNGGSMTLHVGTSGPASPFIISTTPPTSTLITVGGILTVGGPSANPAGSYTGTFYVTFIEQ